MSARALGEKYSVLVSNLSSGFAYMYGRVWLTNLSSKLPASVQLDGLDVSFHATPPPGCLPANVTLKHWDIKEPPPSDIVGVYDIVHLRNFIFVLADAELPGVIDNVMKLLKPGGYLQWGEVDMNSWRVHKTKSDSKTTALEKLFATLQSQDTRLKPTWASSLAGGLSAAGLEAVESDVQDMPPHLELATAECNMLLPDLIMRKAKRENSAQATLLGELLQEVAAETREGAFWAFTRCTVIGRKPM